MKIHSRIHIVVNVHVVMFRFHLILLQGQSFNCDGGVDESGSGSLYYMSEIIHIVALDSFATKLASNFAMQMTRFQPHSVYKLLNANIFKSPKFLQVACGTSTQNPQIHMSTYLHTTYVTNQNRFLGLFVNEILPHIAFPEGCQVPSDQLSQCVSKY